MHDAYAVIDALRGPVACAIADNESAGRRGRPTVPSVSLSAKGAIVIVRSFRGVVVRGREAVFYEIVRRRIAEFRRSHALIESHVARRMTDEGDRFLVTTHWPDWVALLEWAAGDLERPWGFDEIVPYLTTWEIEHFEEIEIDPAETPAGDRERLGV
jgi:heme-degrading monooxygenase HmoA